MAKLQTLEEVEIARILLALPRVDPKTGRRPRGSLTPAHKKLLKRLNNLTYSRDHRAELAVKARQYYAAKQAKLGKTVRHYKKTPPIKPSTPRQPKQKSFLQRLLGIW